MIQDTRIAVVGMSLKYPSAKSKYEFHTMLSNGQAAPVSCPQIRGDLLGIPEYEKLIRNIRCIDDIDAFDNSFFGIVTPEVMEMPPEMRYSLQYAAEAVMDAGYSLRKIADINCGAVVTHTVGSYRKLLQRNTFLSFFNNMPGMTCGYLAHYLKLTGPAYHLDSTCSSSLTAVVNACNHLIMHQADLMIAGGVQLCLPTNEQESKDMFSSVLSLGSDQQCVPFDKNANGFYNGEGVGFVVLERYEDAINNGDHIYGIIRGYGMCSNSDLAPTIYAPNAKSQNVALNKAWDMAGITANDITEFEAHGAATKQGDAAEIENLTQALTGRTIEKPVYLTAVKSNLGHTACAAGITSLLKILSEFSNNMVYPIAGFQEPNPELDFDAAHVLPVGKAIAVPCDERRIVDIGSYGLNELNVHIILEKPPMVSVEKENNTDKNRFLKCSAKTEPILRNFIRNISLELSKASDSDFENIIYTLNSGRDDFAYRCFIRFRTRDDLIRKLNEESSVEIVKCKPQKVIINADCYEQLESVYLQGKSVNWDYWYGGCKYRKAPTTIYPFAEKRIWPVATNVVK